MNRLTVQQQAVFDFIRECIFSRGYGPTVREIGQYMSIKSPNGVMCHLRALEKKGYIRRSANKSRSIELTQPLPRLDIGLQVRGAIASGTLQLHESSRHCLKLVNTLGSEETFLIEIQDDCLASWRVHQGDQLVLKSPNGSLGGQVLLVQDSKLQSFGIGTGIPNGETIQFQPLAGSMGRGVVQISNVVGVALGVVRFFGSGNR